jgi:hypothetical protein
MLPEHRHRETLHIVIGKAKPAVGERCLQGTVGSLSNLRLHDGPFAIVPHIDPIKSGPNDICPEVPLSALIGDAGSPIPLNKVHVLLEVVVVKREGIGTGANQEIDDAVLEEIDKTC